MFDFPSSPTDGQVYTPVGGPTYYWDATDGAWRLAGAKTGSGSGLDADTLDGNDSTYFATQAALTTEKNRNDTQDTAIALRITDAPSDANAYGRKAAAWVDVTEEAPSDGLTYGRKSGAWATVVGGAWTDDNPPAPPLVDGQLWYKSSTGVLYIYYDDGTSQQWVQVSASPQSPNSGFAFKTARRTNLVINGALNVSQENGNTEGTVSSYYAADQFFCGFVASTAAFGFGRIANANASGSQYRLRFRVTTAKAALAAGDFASILTKLEGLNVQDLNWSNAGNQKDAVLQFGFNGPAGTYSISIRNYTGSAVTHSFVASFVITAGQAGTDTVQIIKIPAPPAGMTTWATDNSTSIILGIHPAVGTTYLATAGWNSGEFLGVTGMSNGLAAVQSFQIWDIGLYADPDKTALAPMFEVLSFADELARCQRYWFRSKNSMICFPRTGTDGLRYSAGYWPTTLRVNPTITANGQLNYGGSNVGMTGSNISISAWEYYYDTGAAGNSFVCNNLIANARM